MAITVLSGEIPENPAPIWPVVVCDAWEGGNGINLQEAKNQKLSTVEAFESDELNIWSPTSATADRITSHAFRSDMSNRRPHTTKSGAVGKINAVTS